MDNILAVTKHLIYDSTTGDFPTSGRLNLSGTITAANNLFTFKVTAIGSPDSSTYRGFYFGIGGKHHRIKFSYDYRFVPDTEGETAVMNQCGYEGAGRYSLTMTPDWQSYSDVANRTDFAHTYSAFCFYRSAKSFPLGTFYIRNLKIETFPWIYTVGGRPLKVSV